MNGDVVSALQAVLDDAVAAGAPGAILAVEAPPLGISFLGSSGLFAKTSRRALRPTDPFRAASVTKAVTAAAAVQLAAQGRWKLDDGIAAYLPSHVPAALGRLEGLDDLGALTLRRLLSHTSGLPDYFFDDEFQDQVRAQPNRTWEPEELVRAATVGKRLTFHPGSDFAYGDTGYVLAGLAIQEITGCPLGEAYRSLVFEPLSMNATYLEWHEPRRGGEVSHHYKGDRDLQPTNTSYDWAGGGLVATASDLVRLMQGLFHGALFDSNSLQELLRWRDELKWRPNSSARYRRYGLGLGANLARGEVIIGATGVWGAFAYYWPAGDAAIAGTVNQVGFDRGLLLDEVVGVLRRACEQ